MFFLTLSFYSQHSDPTAQHVGYFGLLKGALRPVLEQCCAHVTALSTTKELTNSSLDRLSIPVCDSILVWSTVDINTSLRSRRTLRDAHTTTYDTAYPQRILPVGPRPHPSLKYLIRDVEIWRVCLTLECFFRGLPFAMRCGLSPPTPSFFVFFPQRYLNMEYRQSSIAGCFRYVLFGTLILTTYNVRHTSLAFITIIILFTVHVKAL